jgi:predicted RNase H-like HicB family nuclease
MRTGVAGSGIVNNLARLANRCRRRTDFRISWREEVLMIYKIALHEDEEGFSVSVPGLPGCWSQGASEVEALANAKDAIREYLAARDDLLKGSDVRELEIAV